MIEIIRAVVDHSVNVRIIVLIIVIEGVEKHAQTVPPVGAAEHRSIVIANLRRVPKCLRTTAIPLLFSTKSYLHVTSISERSILRTHHSIRAYPTPAGNPKHELHFPPFEIDRSRRPYGACNRLPKLALEYIPVYRFAYLSSGELTFLAFQRGSKSYVIRAGNRICEPKKISLITSSLHKNPPKRYTYCRRIGKKAPIRPSAPNKEA